MRHNELRDVTANLLQGVCSDVQVEPPLQPLSGENLSLRSANRDDGARLDVAATNFWSRNRQRNSSMLGCLIPLRHPTTNHCRPATRNMSWRRGVDTIRGFAR